MQEREIIELIGNRDEKGVDELMKHYGPLIKYIIAPILESPQDREECLGEAVMKIWDKIEQFSEQRGSFKAWITAIARNTALNHRRRNEAHGSGEELLESVPAGEATPEEQVLRNERREELKRALYRLSAKDRALFYRKYYYCQSIEQIAAEAGMTKRAVEGRLYRIKKQLRQILGGEYNG